MYNGGILNFVVTNKHNYIVSPKFEQVLVYQL